VPLVHSMRTADRGETVLQTLMCDQMQLCTNVPSVLYVMIKVFVTRPTCNIHFIPTIYLQTSHQEELCPHKVSGEPALDVLPDRRAVQDVFRGFYYLHTQTPCGPSLTIAPVLVAR